MARRSNRTRGTKRDNLGRSLKAMKMKPLANAVRGGLGIEESIKYTFDGSTMYATIPDWTPNGLPFSVEVSATPLTVDAGGRTVLATAVGNTEPRHYEVDTFAETRLTDVDGVVLTVRSTPAIPAAGVGATAKWTASANGTSMRYNGAGQDKATVARSKTGNPYQLIGAWGPAPVQHFHGPIYNLKLTDNSPIQDTTACFGNATRYVELENPIVLEGDFEIEFDWIRQDETGTGAVSIIGGAGNQVGGCVEAKDTGHATAPNELTFRWASNAFSVPAAYENIALGQHCRTKITWGGGVFRAFVDGVEKGSGSPLITRVNISTTGARGDGTHPFPANSALQNIVIRDLTNDLTWEYKLDEGSDTAANNTGTAQGNYLNQPLWDRATLDGNGARYIEIPLWTASSGDNFRVKFDAVRVSGFQKVLGDVTTTDSGVQVDGAADSLALRISAINSTFTSALSGVAAGQHHTIEFVVGASVECFVDGVSKGTEARAAGDFTVSELLRSSNFPVLAGGALGNVILENLSLPESDPNSFIEYRIDEGSGTTVKAYDRAGNEVPASNGTITPNASWTQQPEYSNNGTWTPDTDWQAVPDNSRFYPMNQAADRHKPGYFACFDGNGDRLESADATIVNYDPDSWQYLP